MRYVGAWLARGVALATVSGIMLGTGGCRPAAPEETGQAGGKASVKVGVILPLSGPLAPFGKSCLDGVRFGVDEWNAAGGGATVDLVVEDNKGDKTESVSAFKKLSGVDGVSAVIGPITSTNCLGIVRHTERERVPTISPTATNDTVAPKSPYMFRACFNDSFQGRIVANYAFSNRQIRKAAVMTDLSSDYSKGLAASFKAAFMAAGGAVVAEEAYQQKDTEFGVQLSKIKSSGAGLVFVPGYPPEVPLIIRQGGVIGLDATFCGADGWDHEAVIGNSGDKIIGSFLVGAFSREDQRPTVQQFVSKIEEKLGREAGTFEALGYDSVKLLGAALQTGTSREEIRTGLLGLRNVEGVTGTISITADGDAEKSAVILGIEKDAGTFVKKYLATVAP